MKWGTIFLIVVVVLAVKFAENHFGVVKSLESMVGAA